MYLKKGGAFWQARWKGKEGVQQLQRGKILDENEEVEGDMS